MTSVPIRFQVKPSEIPSYFSNELNKNPLINKTNSVNSKKKRQGKRKTFGKELIAATYNLNVKPKTKNSNEFKHAITNFLDNK